MLKSFLTLLLTMLTMTILSGLLPCMASGVETSDARLEIDVSASYSMEDNYLHRIPLTLSQKAELIRQHGRWESLTLIEQVTLLGLEELHFSDDKSYSLVNLRPSLWVAAAKGIQGYLGVDISWQNPVDKEDGDEDEVDVEVTTAYLSLQADNIRADIGIQTIEFAKGFILSDDIPGAVIHGKADNVYVEIKAASVLDSSPIAGITLGYNPGLFEYVELFGIWFEDQDDTFADTVPLIYHVFADLTSEGTLYYYGGSAELFIGETLLSLTGAYQTGEYTLRDQIEGNSRTYDVEAYFGDASLERNLSEWCSVGLFFYMASGDGPPADDELEAFVSILPYFPRAIIFFDPAFRDRYNSDGFTYGGGFYGGVMAPGIRLTFLSQWGFAAEATAVSFYAHQARPDDSQMYGWEADLTISYTYRKDFRIFAEAARFEFGDYFESLLNEQIDPAFRFMVGLQASF